MLTFVHLTLFIHASLTFSLPHHNNRQTPSSLNKLITFFRRNTLPTIPLLETTTVTISKDISSSKSVTTVRPKATIQTLDCNQQSLLIEQLLDKLQLKESEVYQQWRDAFQQASEIQLLRKKLSQRNDVITEMNDEFDHIERRQYDEIASLKIDLEKASIENLRLKKEMQQQ